MAILSANAVPAKPFLKWAGGKSQLLPAIAAALPARFRDKPPAVYIEPFIGSGAVLFWFLQQYPRLRKAVINDINPDITHAYATIKEQPFALVEALEKIQARYYRFTREEDRKAFFLEQRESFNTRSLDALDNTVLLIFLNRTCYNGLYRVNSRNRFNVPFGRYRQPRLCDADTIVACHHLLQKVTILNGDYRDTLRHAGRNTFFYFDPPYRPISRTSSFNAYAKDSFDDQAQVQLKRFCDTLATRGHQWLLSNSDPRNVNAHDDFFDTLYRGDSIYIDRVRARRIINSNSARRGDIFELLISNYPKQSS